MNQAKILIITKEDKSSWKSCQHIVHNLIQSYELMNSSYQIDYLKVKEDFSYYQALNHAKIIQEMKVDFIVWVDHRPCSAFMLNALNTVYAEKSFEEKPKLIIHLFGDFVLDCLTWESAHAALNEYPVKLITASMAQKKLVDKMFQSTNILSMVIPFPVDDKFFNLKNLAENRQEIRKLTNVGNDDIVILYTGRISFQKNIDDLAIAFAKINKFVDKKIHLWFAGPWDDIILPYLGMRGFPGSHYTHYNTTVSGHDLSNVKFLGDLESDDLIKTYHAADLFVSFSTYNDEDYGMSVAEALLTGLPCLLSSWGGFSSFKEYSKSVDLIDCKFFDVRMRIDGQMAQKKLLSKIIQISNNQYSKKQITEEALNSLSIKAVSNKLNDMLMSGDRWKNEVEFTSLFKKMCSLFKISQVSPFKDNLSIYEEIYGDYYVNSL